MHQDGCFWGQLYLRNVLQWLLLKESCEDIFSLEILGCAYFTILTDVILKRNEFYEHFLSEGFSKKCKHTKLALNFIDKQYFC